jgi:hypothetical protein
MLIAEPFRLVHGNIRLCIEDAWQCNPVMTPKLPFLQSAANLIGPKLLRQKSSLDLTIYLNNSTISHTPSPTQALYCICIFASKITQYGKYHRVGPHPTEGSTR